MKKALLVFFLVFGHFNICFADFYEFKKCFKKTSKVIDRGEESISPSYNSWEEYSKVRKNDDEIFTINLSNNILTYTQLMPQEQVDKMNEAMKKIYSRVETKQNPDFSAKFVSCLSLKFHDGKIFTYNGEIQGKITWPPKGDNGFGYDPFFIPTDENLTYGEVEYSTKILTDHRSVAFKKLAKVHLKNS